MVCGDLVPTESNMMLFEQDAAEELVGTCLLEILNRRDICVCNLEAPVVDETSPIKKCGPNLSMPTVALNALHSIGITTVNLANNHILDQGIGGIESTFKELDKKKIAHFGAGSDLASADNYFVFTDGIIKIGIYGVAEHEFSIATENSPGANPYDPLITYERIKSIKSQCDFLLLLYHGGIEEYRYPTPNLQRVCHRFVEFGADFVICQHSHCIGCEEEYQNATIVYGQGNFIFDRKDNEYWENGLIIVLDIDDKRVEKSYSPIVKRGAVIRLANMEEKDAILENFKKRSKLVYNRNALEKEYDHYSEEHFRQYLRAFRGKKSILTKILIRILGNDFVYNHYNNQDFIRMRNYLECEAHYETFLRALKNKSQTLE